MYAVSDAFLEAVVANTRNYYWAGKITTTDGTEYEFGYENILKGSGYISAQCCGSTEIELGTVYSAELGITLFLEVDRYSLEDAIIELSCFLRLSYLKAMNTDRSPDTGIKNADNRKNYSRLSYE